ncbi:MAG: hypothetical protein AAGD01_19475 [Acidobacteriota bacterium]
MRPSLVRPGDLTDPEGELEFYDEQRLDALLTQEYEALGDQPGFITSDQMAHRRVTDLIRRVKEAKSLDEDGCVRPFSDRHREGVYQKPPDTFEYPLRGYHQTPLDLVEKAPEILLVEVEGTEAGVLSGELGTVVKFRVLEWLKRDPEFDELGNPSYFLASDTWLEVDGELYCQRRENVSRPAPGDQMVLFGFRFEKVRSLFWTGNVFPVDQGIILPQPYLLMSQGLPVSLESLKEAN